MTASTSKSINDPTKLPRTGTSQLNGNHPTGGIDTVEHVVLNRYAAAAHAPEAALCCPCTNYDAELLAMLPAEIIEKDYGCGDPSRYVAEGETVIDLGSGAGKICYMLSRKVGPRGRVIGVDFNDAMLALACKYQNEIAGKIGYSNVQFVKARIQDMALDLRALDNWLTAHPVSNVAGVDALEAEKSRIRHVAPAVANDTADVVVSNCVLNLVRAEDKAALFDDIFRVLKRGGRAVISDIVCDETPTESIRNDPKLWSGCIAGAFREDEFLQRFENAGFHGIEILERATQPWRVIDGIEFRSMTVRAFKGKQGPCLEHHQAVVYQGPWKKIVDDDGHVLFRGKRVAVCDKTFRIMTDPNGPYSKQIIGIEPRTPIDADVAKPFACHKQAVRSPRETKGLEYHETQLAADDACCSDESCC